MNKIFKDENYKILIYKIFFKTIFVLVAAVFITMLIGFIGKGNFADLISKFISEKYDISIADASLIYWSYIRKYLNYILIIILVVLIVVFFRILLSGFTSYFDEIISGINQLSRIDDNKINLSKELKFVESRLNKVRIELVEGRKRAKEIEMRKNELIVYLAHDIKTPLTSVIGYLNLLVENSSLTIEEKAKFLNITLEKAYNLEELINEFFEVARYNSSEVILYKESLDVNFMMVQIVEELYPKLSEKGQGIKYSIEENLVINVDREKIARVFKNLLKNAISYGAPNSEIEILGYRDSENSYIKFKNLGVIEEKDIPFVFNKFYRADKGRRSSTGGAGLGLAIAKDIINLHSGEIKIQVDDYYTIFIIKL